MRLAARFSLPLLALIDSQGADPRLESEEQGVGNAIASNLSMMLNAPIPMVSVIIGEAGNEAAFGDEPVRPHPHAAIRDLFSHIAASHGGRPFP